MSFRIHYRQTSTFQRIHYDRTTHLRLTASNQKKYEQNNLHYIHVSFFVTFVLLRIICMSADQVTKTAYESGVVFICYVPILPPITVIFFAYFCVTRRLIDRGKKNNYVWFILIPIFGLGYVLYHCFAQRKNNSQIVFCYEDCSGIYISY